MRANEVKVGVDITHPRNPGRIYTVLCQTKIHINDQWVDGFVYTDGNEQYTRPANEFTKFKQL